MADRVDAREPHGEESRGHACEGGEERRVHPIGDDRLGIAGDVVVAGGRTAQHRDEGHRIGLGWR